MDYGTMDWSENAALLFQMVWIAHWALGVRHNPESGNPESQKPRKDNPENFENPEMQIVTKSLLIMIKNVKLVKYI